MVPYVYSCYECVLMLPYMCPHATVYVSSCYHICVLMLSIYVSSCYYACALMLLDMCALEARTLLVGFQQRSHLAPQASTFVIVKLVS
jgi:hypothetical protein